MKRIAGVGAAAIMLLLAVQVSQAQPPATSVANDVNKKLVKLFGAGGFKGMPSYGTGIVIHPDGYILTVNSIMLTTTDLRVHLYDGRLVHAKILAKEPELDVALLKLEEPVKGLPYYDIVKEAERPAAGPGTWVLAFSNQFAIAERDEPMSVQHGLVQAYADLKGRKGVAEAAFQGKAYFIDVVCCNPGAAGGALTTAKGDLLGILGRELKNKLSDSWINYAVPINATVELINTDTKKTEKISVASFADMVMKGKWKDHEPKKKSKGPGVYTGIQLVPNPVALTPPYIEAVVPDSPADKAGLRTDDLIVYVDGELVQSIKAYRDLINSYLPGQQIQIDVQRGAQLESVTITVEKNK